MSDKIIIPGSRANLTAELREQVIENGKLRRALAETTGTIKSYAAQDAQILAKIEEDAATIDGLRRALVPFAQCADNFGAATPDDFPLHCVITERARRNFTLGDLRAARATMTRITPIK